MRKTREPVGEPLRVNLGAGHTHLPEFVNVDLSPRADVSLNLDRDALPFEDDSVDLVFSYHALEHLENYLFALGEIHRVLKHGAALLVGVPYVTLTEYNLVNPYHRQNFNEHSFDFFDPAGLKGSAIEANDILFTKAFHRFHYTAEFADEPAAAREWARRHLFNVVSKIDFGVLAIKDAANPPSILDPQPARLRALFDECLERRVPYPDVGRCRQAS